MEEGAGISAHEILIPNALSFFEEGVVWCFFWWDGGVEWSPSTGWPLTHYPSDDGECYLNWRRGRSCSFPPFEVNHQKEWPNTWTHISRRTSPSTNEGRTPVAESPDWSLIKWGPRASHQSRLPEIAQVGPSIIQAEPPAAFTRAIGADATSVVSKFWHIRVLGFRGDGGFCPNEILIKRLISTLSHHYHLWFLFLKHNFQWWAETLVSSGGNGLLSSFSPFAWTRKRVWHHLCDSEPAGTLVECGPNGRTLCTLWGQLCSPSFICACASKLCFHWKLSFPQLLRRSTLILACCFFLPIFFKKSWQTDIILSKPFF